MKSKGENRKKKPYRPPRIVTYGDFRSLTRTQSKGGVKGDGGGAPKSKL
ncbi:MAG: lasso RiPP family leader peptide-containing protein [candidate division NC10 bacterium]